MKMVEDFGILIVVSSIFYATGLDCGKQRAMETDEVRGRPLDSFAFAI